MPFTLESFTELGSNSNSNSPNSWSYRTSDTLAEVVAIGYFSDIYNLLNECDLIAIAASDNTSIGFIAASGDDFSVIEESTFSATVGTGWAQYSDGQYTSASPQLVNEGITAVLGNNAASVIDSHLPPGITELYDGTKITPENSGDAYLLRVNFKAFTSSQNGVLEVALDIGGAQGVILSEDVAFPRGTGSGNVRDITRTFLIYSLGTFIANGGEIKVTSVRGNTSIYETTYVISRVHKAL